MKQAICSVLLVSAVASSTAFAHGDHVPPPKVAVCKAKECTKAEVIDGTTSKILPMLIEKGKIDPTWKGLSPAGAEQKQFKGGKEWVLTVKNEQVVDKAKQTLYIFVEIDGTLSGVNFTGQ